MEAALFYLFLFGMLVLGVSVSLLPPSSHAVRRSGLEQSAVSLNHALHARAVHSVDVVVVVRVEAAPFS
jgi:hypothetical protein